MPLTTYTFSTGSASDNPVSATDEERLPPGGFSLRHGFPHWFGRAKRSGVASGTPSRNVSGNSAASKAPVVDTPEPSTTAAETGNGEPDADNSKENTRVSQVPSSDDLPQPRKAVPVSELLDYIRSTFDDEAVLDSLPVEAAGNPGAWHAWKAHRRGGSHSGGLRKASPHARLPGDWHWDGIWARRVQDEIEMSHSDPILFGGASRGNGDDMVSLVSRGISIAGLINPDTILTDGRKRSGLGEGDDGGSGEITYRGMIRACLNIPSKCYSFQVTVPAAMARRIHITFRLQVCLCLISRIWYTLQDDQYLILGSSEFCIDYRPCPGSNCHPSLCCGCGPCLL